MFSNKKHFLL